MDKTVFEPRERGYQEGEMRTPSEAEFDAVKDKRFSPQIYEKLKRAKVAIAGLGGLGSHIAVMLARSGVGHLHLVDLFCLLHHCLLNHPIHRHHLNYLQGRLAC